MGLMFLSGWVMNRGGEMKTGTYTKVGRLAFRSWLFVAMLGTGLGLGQPATAATADIQYQLFIQQQICAVAIEPSWDSEAVTQLCDLTGGGAGGGTTPSVNLGTSNAGGTAASRKKKGVREYLDEQKEKTEKGASADGGGWGVLVSPQYGKSDRVETDLENGFRSDLTGLVIGIDYQLSDNTIFGFVLGQTKDEAAFLNDAGSLTTVNNSITIYSTWMPTEYASIDGYLGYGNIKLDSMRNVVYGSITGSASGNTVGRQLMGGISASYTTDIGRVSLSPYLSLDSIKSDFDGYDETGNTLFELHFSDRTVLSTTSSLGARISSSINYAWGSLAPSISIAAVHEFQNKSRQISNELVITPGTGFMVETDSPDRDYFNLGMGIATALNSGAQLFLSYEKRTQDKLLSSWAVGIGGLFVF